MAVTALASTGIGVLTASDFAPTPAPGRGARGVVVVNATV